jgi:hypothetical protein
MPCSTLPLTSYLLPLTLLSLCPCVSKLGAHYIIRQAASCLLARPSQPKEGLQATPCFQKLSISRRRDLRRTKIPLPVHHLSSNRSLLHHLDRQSSRFGHSVSPSRSSPDCAGSQTAAAPGRENVIPAAHLLTASDQRSLQCPFPFSKAASLTSLSI